MVDEQRNRDGEPVSEPNPSAGRPTPWWAPPAPETSAPSGQPVSPGGPVNPVWQEEAPTGEVPTTPTPVVPPVPPVDQPSSPWAHPGSGSWAPPAGQWGQAGPPPPPGPAQPWWAGDPAGGGPGSYPPYGGGSGGYPPYGGLPGGAPGTPPGGPKRRRRSRRVALVAGATAVVLAAGGLGAGLTAVFTGSPSTGPSSRTAASEPIPRTTNGTINVGAIAGRVDPAVVDITNVGQGAGTGMILTPSGEVLTNNHVVEGGTHFRVRVAGHAKPYQARVLGTDATDDVALLQVEGASGLPTVTLGNSAKISVGDPVVAIGNALNLQGSPTVTQGTVSALNRTITASESNGSNPETLHGLLQTDASINPGNSGGPLVNAAGRVIGMNTANASGTQAQTASNISFAIPINTAKSVVSRIRGGHSTSTIQVGQRGYLGVQVVSASAVNGNSSNPFGGAFGYTPAVKYGALIEQVESGAAAGHAGMRAGDVIVSLNGKTVPSATALTRDLTGSHPGESVTVGWVTSSGAHRSASLHLGPGPAA